MHDNFPDSDDGADEAGEQHERDSETATDDGVIVIAGKRYLTRSRLAKQLERCDRTVQRWIEARIGPPCIKVGTLTLFDEEKIPGWLESHEIGPLPDRRRRPTRFA